MSTSLKGMINMNRILALIAATAIGALLASAAYVTGTTMPYAHASEVIRDHPVVHGVVAKATGRPCLEEDSINCYWNARSQGNGQGHSFYSIRVGGRDCIIYWDRHYNRRHGHCI